MVHSCQCSGAPATISAIYNTINSSKQKTMMDSPLMLYAQFN